MTENKKEHRKVNQRYDVFNPQTGLFEFRVWSPYNKPVFNEQGSIKYIIHSVEDITEKVRLQKENAVKEEPLSEIESRFRHMEQQPVLS